MWEVLTESIRLVNLPFTALLVGLLIYWLLVMVGLLHFDTGADSDIHLGGEADAAPGADIGAHVDAHAEVDAGGDLGGEAGDFHAEAHTEAGGDLGGEAHTDAGADPDPAAGGHGPGLVASALRFINLGDVPAMIVVTVQALCMWVFSMIANHYWNEHSLWRGLVFVVPNVVLSAVFTRYLTWPMARFFRALNREYEEHRPLIGRTCVVTTSEVTGDFGQARIETRGAPVVINVRTTEPHPLRRGETGLVVREDRATHLYYIRKVTPENLEA